MTATEITPADRRWLAYCEHLNQCGHGRWVIDDTFKPLQDNLYYLMATDEDGIVGSLTILRQQIVSPASEWAGDRDRVLRDTEGKPLEETFVQTFFVDEDYRRRGHGRELQLAALQKTRELGCFQMRSWSSLDKPANYQLKLDLGFAFHPEVQETASGLKVSGGYFVRTV